MIDLQSRNLFAKEIKNRLRDLNHLPPLPEVARELIELRNRGGNIEQLVAVIERDPVLSAQLVRYARAPAYGYSDRIKSLAQAVLLVLGYEKSLNLAFGLCAGKSLQMPASGPLGRKVFWQRSLSIANLSRALATKTVASIRPNPDICYLAGLLHSFGQLLFAHLYPDHYAKLDELYAHDSTQDLRELELRCFGVSHDFIGMWLMRAWQMPEEVVVAVSEHFFPDYDGEYAAYAKVVALAARYSNAADGPPVAVLDSLGISTEIYASLLAAAAESEAEIAVFASSIAA